VGNVYDAMKKHEAEQAEQASQSAPAQGQAEQPAEAPPAAGQAQAGPQVASPAPRPAPAAAAISRNGNYSELLVAHHDRGGPITEEYRALRTNLLASCPDGRLCYLVTSAEAGEGKTITCMNLALVMAERVDRRTIVIDSDLRKGRMAKLLGAPASPGVADLLLGSKALKECVQATGYPNLFFLPAGEVESRQVGELVGRPEFEEVTAQLRREYDCVIFDTPPINRASDAGIMGRAIGEALLVLRMNRTHRETVDKAIRLLHAANVKVNGIVLTHQKYYIPNYLYRYS